jgi:WD40 repeat protein
MLDLANDCFRFVTGYFEVISTSAPHIYHSALVLAPRNSIVRKLYESHAHPFARVVHGAPMSWGPCTVATTRPSTITMAVWSSCNGFIAITSLISSEIHVLDSATFQRLQVLESPQDVSTNYKALVFSPDSRTLTCSGYGWGPDWPERELFVVNWDLQTGGVANIIRWQGPGRGAVEWPSITYSANGKVVAVFYRYCDGTNSANVFVCDVASGVYMYSYSLMGGIPLSNNIWAHEECWQFATVDTTAITIWEVGSVPGGTPMEVETLPAPDDFDFAMLPSFDGNKCRFLPTLCRLAVAFRGKVMVWDARNSKYLLHCTDTSFRPMTSFSSDGRFFACSTAGSDIYLWKESPTEYILHEILAPRTLYPGNPLLSGNGESIIVFGSCMIGLWRTNSLTTRPSSILTQGPQLIEDFVLDFSPDGTLAAVAMKMNDTITVLSLKCGVPQLTIDAGMGVCGLRVIGNSVVVIGDRKVITWNLPAGGCVPNARVSLEDSSRVINLGGSQDGVTSGTISTDFRYVALEQCSNLHVYSASTGEYLGKDMGTGTPWFAPEGCDLWRVGYGGGAVVLRVVDEEDLLECTKLTVNIEHPPEGYPWGSSRGYRVTKDWWILGPDGKRLLMLPPPWQSYAVLRVWKGKFLALLHCGLSEPVILEVEP